MAKNKVVLALGAISVLTLTGCSGGGGTAPGAEEFDETSQAEISFSWWGNEQRADQFEQALDLFNEQYPNVDVVRNFNSWNDYWTSRNTEAAGRALPDVIMMDAGYLAEYANKGLFLDLGQYRDTQLELGGFEDVVLESGTIDGELVGIPMGTNAWSMMYNKDLLDELGIDHPTDDMTWDELEEFVREVNDAGAASSPTRYGAEDYTGGFPNFIYSLMQEGNPVFDENGAPAFDEQDVVSFVDSVEDLRADGGFFPVERNIALSPLGGFLAGEAAVWFNFSTTVMQAMTDTGTENIGMVVPPAPQAAEERVLAPKASMLLSVAANSEQPAAAAALVDFLVTSPDVAEIFGTTLGTPPTQEGRDAIDQSPADAVNLDYLSENEDALSASYPVLPAGYGTIEAKWAELHEQLQYGDITSEEFATELFNEMSLVLQG